MGTFSALLALCAENSPVTGEFPAQRPVTRIFDIFFDLRMNTRLNKYSWGWWFETLSRPLWRHSKEPHLRWIAYSNRKYCVWLLVDFPLSVSKICPWCCLVAVNSVTKFRATSLVLEQWCKEPCTTEATRSIENKWHLLHDTTYHVPV